MPASSESKTITAAELKGFDKESSKLILEAMRAGCTGRVSSKGHALIYNNAGDSTSVPRRMTAAGRTAGNTHAAVKTLMQNHQVTQSTEEPERTTQSKQLTVAAALVEFGLAFSHWMDSEALQLPAQAIIQATYRSKDDPSFKVIDAAPAVPGPAPVPDSKEPPEPLVETAVPQTPDNVLSNIRALLGADPQMEAKNQRIHTLEELVKKLTGERNRARTEARTTKQQLEAAQGTITELRDELQESHDGLLTVISDAQSRVESLTEVLNRIDD